MSIIGDGPKLALGYDMCRPREGLRRDEGEIIMLENFIWMHEYCALY